MHQRHSFAIGRRSAYFTELLDIAGLLGQVLGPSGPHATLADYLNTLLPQGGSDEPTRMAH